MTQNDQAAMNEQLTELRLNGLIIDGDNRYKQDLIDAFIGAMMFGAQGANPPPAGHWLEQFYVIAREEREALARVEAELNAKPADDLAQACIAQLIESGAENYTEHQFGFVRDGEDVERPAVVTVQFSDRPSPHELRIKAEAERDTAQAQLAEAVGLLRYAMESSSFREILTLERDIAAFLARNAQAEQQEAQSPMAKMAEGLRQKAADEWASHPSNPANQEAQGALAGDLASTVRVLLEVPQLQGEQAFSAQPIIDRVRAALTTQPAAGEPIHQWADQDLWMDGDEADMASARAEGFKTRTLWTAPPAAAHGDEAVRWVPCSERLPEVAQFDQQEFIVSVQRKDKVITMSALYLNAYPLYCEDHDDADDEGYVPHTGWYDAKSNGDDANCYTLVNDSWYGSTVTHWMPMPKPAAAMRAQGDGEAKA